MVLRFDRRHRVKTDKWLNISRPQWKGRFFWHNYAVISPRSTELRNDGMVCESYDIVTDKAVFFTAADALRFLRIALMQEFDGRQIGVVSDSVDNFPSLKLE